MRSGIDLQMVQPQYEVRNYSVHDYEQDRSAEDAPVTKKTVSRRGAGYGLWMGLRNVILSLSALPRHIAV